MGGKRLEKYYCYKKQLFCGSEREIRGMVELAENIHTVRELLKSGNQGTVQCLFKNTPNLYILWNISIKVSDNLWTALYMIVIFTEFTGTTLLSVSFFHVFTVFAFTVFIVTLLTEFTWFIFGSFWYLKKYDLLPHIKRC